MVGVALGTWPADAADPPAQPVVEIDDMGLIIDPTVRGTDEPPMWVSDEFIVVFDRPARRKMQVISDHHGAARVNFPQLQNVINDHNITRFARQFPTAQPQAKASRFPDLTGHYKVRLAAGSNLERAMEAFERLGIVQHVEKIGVHFVTIDPNDPWYKDPPPNFPFDQWHYWDTFGIAADLAWDIETGSPDVVVAVVDTGVRYFHIDLGGPNAPWGPDDPKTNGNIWINPDEIPGGGIDDDDNGFIDDTIGWDFVASTAAAGCTCLDVDCSVADNDPDDGDGHGTHVAGTIAAMTHNTRVGAGVAGGFSNGTVSGAGNGVRIMPLRIGWRARCQGITTGVVRMDYAAEAFHFIGDQVQGGVNVAAVNCSWGSSNTGGLGAATDNLIAHAVMIVVAAGNSNSTDTGFLGGRSDTVTVAATTRSGTGASFTNHGSTITVAAPGKDILSTYRNPDDPDPNNHYVALLEGTSMSVPHVAGIAGLLRSCNPKLTHVEMTNRIVSTATPYTDERNLGSGIANAFLTLQTAGCVDEPECTIAADCDDENFCTIDECSGGVCTNEPLFTENECCNPETGTVCLRPAGEPGGDFDGDGAVTLADFREVQVCFGRETADAGCQLVETACDCKVDELDVAGFIPLLEGPTVP